MVTNPGQVTSTIVDAFSPLNYVDTYPDLTQFGGVDTFINNSEVNTAVVPPLMSVSQDLGTVVFTYTTQASGVSIQLGLDIPILMWLACCLPDNSASKVVYGIENFSLILTPVGAAPFTVALNFTGEGNGESTQAISRSFAMNGSGDDYIDMYALDMMTYVTGDADYGFVTSTFTGSQLNPTVAIGQVISVSTQIQFQCEFYADWGDNPEIAYCPFLTVNLPDLTYPTTNPQYASTSVTFNNDDNAYSPLLIEISSVNIPAALSIASEDLSTYYAWYNLFSVDPHEYPVSPLNNVYSTSS